MSIRFEVCPVHEPTAVEYERPCVFNDETGRWACAVCGAEGDLDEGKPIVNVPPPVWLGNINSVVEKAKENGDATIVVKCFESEET